MAVKKKKRQQSEASKARRKAKREAHAAFLQTQNITHFARSHSDCHHAGKRLCNNYPDKAGKQQSMGLEGEAAVHHVLPVSAVVGFMKKYKDDKIKLNRVASVYAQMDWCINLDENLLWLPYFPAYRRHLAAQAVSQAPDKEAAHNYDHAQYTADVVSNLEDSWESIAGMSKDKAKECKKHEEMVTTLTGKIGSFKPNLINRTPHPILQKAVDLKKAAAPKAKRDQELANWWLTFSMFPGGANPRDVNLLFPRVLTQKMKAAITRPGS